MSVGRKGLREHHQIAAKERVFTWVIDKIQNKSNHANKSGDLFTVRTIGKLGEHNQLLCWRHYWV